MDLIQDDFLDLSMPVNFSERLREAGLQDMVDVPLSLERELAEEQHRNHFVTGSVRTVDGVVEATVSLYETQRGRLVEERTYSGSDVLDLADQISVNLKEDLRIPQMGREGIQDLPVSEILTGSPEAYRLSTEFIIASQIERDFARGVSLLEQAVAVDPTYADAQHTLATLYLYTNQAELMAEPMQAAMDHIYRLPERLRFVVKSNYYFLVRQDMDKALASLVMWAELFPDDILAYQAQLQIQMVQDDKEGALESLNKILELDPGQRDVLLQIGDLHEAMGNLAAAEESFQKYAGEFPDDHEVLARLAALARRSGNLDRARELFDRALIMDPSDIGLLVGIGSVHLAAGEFERARGQFDEALDLASTPDNRAQVYSAIESYHVSRGQIDSAIVVMEQRLAEASTFQPPILVAQYRLGGVGRYAEAGRVEEAFRVLEEARSELTAPIDQMVPLGELRIHMVLENADEIEATIPRVEAFIDLLRYEMLRPEVVSAQGLVHELRGEHTEAIEKYEEEHRLKPADFTILTDLGRCHRKLGQFDQAVEYISEALLNSPFGPRTNYEMALTYEAMGRMDDAREHLNRSLEVWAEADPEYRWARRAREAAERIGG